MLQFQEQLGQGCSPEESDTFQAQGQRHEVSKRLIRPDSSCMFDVFVLYSWRIRYSRPDAAVPWTSTEAYATAGGITFNNTVRIKQACRGTTWRSLHVLPWQRNKKPVIQGTGYMLDQESAGLCVSSGLSGYGGSVCNVSTCRGVPHSRQPGGHAGEAANGR